MPRESEMGQKLPEQRWMAHLWVMIHLLPKLYHREASARQHVSRGANKLLQCMGNILALPTTPYTASRDAHLDLSHMASSIQAVVAASNGVAMALGPNISGI
eukprot:9350044-Ditylum_brightwellii.AAC.1